ncbi:C2H2-type zinc finger family protein [Euphorbia peplus]|nr:C2H2-type zinc finger family protein [Euphorbia peplus]
MAASSAFQLPRDASSSPSIDNDSAASKAKISLKIKLPSIASPLADAGGGVGGVGHIICEYCGKRFTSGKAWGGHKRHHLQMERKQQLEVKLFKKKKQQHCRAIYAGDVSIKDGTPVCCLCYKVFPSLNSLFGHMRFHPERDWRGIQPPKAEAEAGIQEKKGRTIDLLSDLVGWRMKDKRGRICIRDQAAHTLVILSRDRTQAVVFENENLMVDSSLMDESKYRKPYSNRKQTIDLNKRCDEDEGEDGEET